MKLKVFITLTKFGRFFQRCVFQRRNKFFGQWRLVDKLKKDGFGELIFMSRDEELKLFIGNFRILINGMDENMNRRSKNKCHRQPVVARWEMLAN